MTNRSKAKGTAAESAVEKAALAAGLAAHRCALNGSSDVGDVHIQHGRIVVEVKAGKTAESASNALCAAWWQETEAEANRVPQCDLAVLVVKRKGVGQARGWRAFIRIDELAALLQGTPVKAHMFAVGGVTNFVEMPFGALLDAVADRAGVDVSAQAVRLL